MEINYKALQNGSDIRGIASEGIADEKVNLTPEIVANIAKSFVFWLKEAKNEQNTLKIAIGNDSRISANSLKTAVIQSIVSLGCKVYDCGLASTPAMFTTCINEATQCDGAIMLTASHLPFNRNGMKFFTAKGGLEKQNIAEILAIAEKNILAKTSIEGSVEQIDFMSIYAGLFVQQVRKEVNHPKNYNQPLENLRIIVDAGNGAGGFYAEKVLKPLGADTIGSQFLEPDGLFPNHIPNPEDKTAMQFICKAVIENKADFGIIFDTDVDRAAAVDSSGKEINRNRLIALISNIVLDEHPASTIVTDSITSDGLAWFIENKLGGKHHRYMRGYKNVINESIRLNNLGQESWLAIETSGHAAMKENYFLDDGAYLITKLLIKLAKLNISGQKINDLISELPEPVESEEFRFKIQEADFKTYGKSVIEELEKYTNEISGWSIFPNNFEGIRIACDKNSGNGWFLLRLSLHDPVIPLNVESNEANGVAKIMQKLKVFFNKFDKLEKNAIQKF